MINYQSEYPSSDFLKLERTSIKELSSDALVLYIHLRTLLSNEDNSIEALSIKTTLSRNAVKEAKKELIKKAYLDTKQLFDNKYAFYIGKLKVIEYKERYKKSNSRIEEHQIKKASSK